MSSMIFMIPWNVGIYTIWYDETIIHPTMTHALITINDHLDDLHKKAQRVADPTASQIVTIVQDMIAVMHKERGIGLAAPQVNEHLRIAVFDITPEGAPAREPLVCINPVITKASRDLVMTEEGCLSIPGEFFPIVRTETVTVRYYDIKGGRHSIAATGLMAVALQHEIDHLDGILMTDRYAQQTALRTQFHETSDASTTTHQIG